MDAAPLPLRNPTSAQALTTGAIWERIMATSPSVLDFSHLIRCLQDPGAYPHPVESVRMVQTHISCVFLTGTYAYKVKKPVEFGFLDYRSLPHRHLWCEQDVRLNRRLCPDLYLDVLPITCEGDFVQMGGRGMPIEWAVRMRELRQEDMLPQRLRMHNVSNAEITHLAYRLAEFHRSAPNDDAIRAYGTYASIADMIALTLHTMDTVSQEAESAATRHLLRAYLEGFLENHADRIAQRAQAGYVRDCHGDLRTQNICLDARYDAGIQIFDCIEFNDSFRYIDIAADIAYLAMDLDLAGRTDLRKVLMDAYLNTTEDKTLQEILPFYLVYRAVVRGNIALLAAQESEIPEKERQAQREIAAAAYDLARSYTQKHSKPRLLITVGYSGTGKSVLAAELARRLPALHLSSDRLRKANASISPTARLDLHHYTAIGRADTYRTLHQRACEALNQGQDVLLDATFLCPEEREAAACLATDHDAEFWLLECRVPDALIRERLKARCTDPNASDADLFVYEKQLFDHPKSGDLLLPLSAPCHPLQVDLRRPAAEAAHRIIDALLAQSSNSRIATD